MSTKAPTSPIDICRLACDHCGEAAAINSIENPRTQQEELFARWYDTTRRQVLRKKVWNFAKKKTDVSRTGDGDGQWADAYRLPVDCVRLNHVGETLLDRIRYEMSEGRILASEGNSIPIHYNRDITDVRLFDPMFVTYFALQLASNVAFKLTKKASVVKTVNELLAAEEQQTASIDGQERPPIRVQYSKTTAARRRYRGSQDGDRYWDFT